jgi:hypothetical protein
VWWSTPVIPALGRLRQGDLEFEDSLGYTASSYFRKRKREGEKEGREERRENKKKEGRKDPGAISDHKPKCSQF